MHIRRAKVLHCAMEGKGLRQAGRLLVQLAQELEDRVSAGGESFLEIFQSSKDL